MLILDLIEYKPSAMAEAAIDSFLLVCMSTPVIYLWVIKPYKIEREKEQEYLFQKSRMAQMGEMLSMIAYQWEEPLSAISENAVRLKLMIELSEYDLDDQKQREEFRSVLLENLNKIDGFSKNLSATINDFKDFNKPDKKSSLNSLNEATKKALHMLKDPFEHDGIVIIEKYESRNMINIYEGEIIQAVLNILRNMQENFKEKKTAYPIISLSTYDYADRCVLSICDNGGGIEEDVITKVFDPYFSTKREKNGTGLGLYMSKVIIETHHHGIISVYNKKNGACFVIEIKKENGN